MDRDFLTDLFAPFGTVDIKQMFGGFALLADGLAFGLVAGGQIYLKTDDNTRDRYAAEGCAPFSYVAKGRTMTLKSYWRMPERLYDDPDEVAAWARESLAIARRKAAADAAKAARPKTAAGKPKSARKAVV